MDKSTTPQVHAYAFFENALSAEDGASIVSKAQLGALIATLRQNLPSSIVLLRHLELYPATPTSVILSSFPLASAPSPLSFPPIFALGFFDRASSPGVECWIYTHLDLAISPLPDKSSSVSPDNAESEAAAHLLALFSHLAQSPYGNGLSSSLTGEAITSKHVLVGAVSEPLRRAMVASPAVAHMMRDDLYTSGGPYVKFIFPLAGLAQRLEQTTLPDGLVWDQVTETDYPLVLASNDIVKTPALLRGLPSAALRLPASRGGGIIAWGFLGPNACVRTLYCAEQWRGRGLARLVVLKLLSAAGGLLDGVEDGLAHADSNEANTGSVRLFESLGAKRERSYYWLRVDLERLPR